jgi:type I restriction enzyme S subunit
MEYPTYPKYKFSGLDWLGCVPENWDVRRLKFAVNLLNLKINAKETDLPYMGMENIESFTAKKIYDEENPLQSDGVGSYFNKGDVLFGKLRPYLAKAYLCDSEGFCSSELLVLKGEKILPNYLVNLILSDWFIELVNSSTYGAKMPRASWDYIGNMTCPIPDIKEQQIIADFLDYKTQQIDQLIEKKKALIEKLNEQRIAVITQAVTKGIDKNAKMKPSGVDWLGDVPEHWGVRRLKECSNTISKGTTPSTEGHKILDEGSVRYIKAENISNAEIIRKPQNYIDVETNEVLKRSQLSVGDVLFVIAGATLGKVAIVGKEHVPANTNQAVAFIRPNTTAISEYLSFWLQSFFIKEVTWLFAVQSAQPNLAMSVLGEFAIPLPQINEQYKIIESIKEAVSKVDALLKISSNTIEKLEEYRSSLITAAVTGKINIRNSELPSKEAAK